MTAHYTDNKFVRVEPQDPTRCQAVVRTGQCPYKSIEGIHLCPMHGRTAEKKLEEDKMRMFRLNQWQARVSDFADHEKVKSLREEVGILRILLEETINKCKNSEDLLIYSGKISDLIIKVEKVVSSCHRLEASTGFLLDKTTALNIASQIIDIISEFIQDEKQLEEIGLRIISTFNPEATNEQARLSHQ